MTEKILTGNEAIAYGAQEQLSRRILSGQAQRLVLRRHDRGEHLGWRCQIGLGGQQREPRVLWFLALGLFLLRGEARR